MSPFFWGLLGLLIGVATVLLFRTWTPSGLCSCCRLNRGYGGGYPKDWKCWNCSPCRCLPRTGECCHGRNCGRQDAMSDWF